MKNSREILIIFALAFIAYLIAPAISRTATNPKKGKSNKVKLIKTLSGHDQSSVSEIEFSPDGRLLASTDYIGNVKIWDVSSGAEIRAFSPHNSKHEAYISFSPDGKILASGGCEEYHEDSGCHSGMIKLWDVETGEKLMEIRGIAGWV
ncbi:MAG TPA: hypothetical protein VJZ16_04635, partial [Syntrophales bacterium]|nr:hypothetical protein [Syntrophales bacterium]